MPRQRSQEVNNEEVPSEKVFVAVDVNNLWHACKSIYGPTARVDFLDLIQRIQKGGFSKVPREVRASAYTVVAPHRVETPEGTTRVKSVNNERFVQVLHKFGYTVQTRTMRFEKGIDKPFHTDWDVGIAVDAIHHLNWMDTFVLASGDGDYGLLLQKVREADKRIEIFTFRSRASSILYELANSISYLDDAHIYQERRVPQP